MPHLRLTEKEARAKYEAYVKLNKEGVTITNICIRLGRMLPTVRKIIDHFEGRRTMMFKKERE